MCLILLREKLESRSRHTWCKGLRSAKTIEVDTLSMWVLVIAAYKNMVHIGTGDAYGVHAYKK